MKQAISALTVLGVLAMPVAALAQDTVVVLKVSSSATDGDRQVLTLPSGATVTVPRADVDERVTEIVRRFLAQEQSQKSSSNAPPEKLDYQASIRAGCQKEWGTDFKMRVYCEQQQTEAVTQLAKRNDMSSGDRAAIRAQCLKEWDTDFKMRNYCEEQQLKALQTLGR